MKNIFTALLLFVFALSSQAQSDTTKPVKVAVFIPLYADDVFNGANAANPKANLPKNVLPGLEFYNGVMMAIDSLNNEGTFAEISIYDTKQTSKGLTDIFRSSEFKNVGLIIAAITNTTELKTFSEHALSKNIPMISSTYPNYVGVKENPFFVLLNSSFQAHIEGLHKYMQKNHSSDNIIAVTRKGGQHELSLKNYITNLNNNTKKSPLKLKWISLDENLFTIGDLAPVLDTTKSNVVFVASPLESFGLNIVKTLSENSNRYRTTAIGMPTWDNIRELDRPSCKNVEIVVSTPFLYYSQNKSLSSTINSRYKERYSSRPSDMVFKGYESTFHFTKLLAKHRENLVNNLSDNDYTIFNQFKLQPVKVNATSVKPDLLENKKLYFIRKLNGAVKGIS